MNPSGLRIGTPALTTRGLLEDDMREIASVIATALSDDFDSEKDSLNEPHRSPDGPIPPVRPISEQSRPDPRRRPEDGPPDSSQVPPKSLADQRDDRDRLDFLRAGAERRRRRTAAQPRREAEQAAGS